MMIGRVETDELYQLAGNTSVSVKNASDETLTCIVGADYDIMSILN